MSLDSKFAKFRRMAFELKRNTIFQSAAEVEDAITAFKAAYLDLETETEAEADFAHLLYKSSIRTARQLVGGT